mgnify:CR=1 FL=1
MEVLYIYSFCSNLLCIGKENNVIIITYWFKGLNICFSLCRERRPNGMLLVECYMKIQKGQTFGVILSKKNVDASNTFNAHSQMQSSCSQRNTMHLNHILNS